MVKCLLLAIGIAGMLGLNAQVSPFEKYELIIPGGTVKQEMVPIPAGSFSMGASAGKEKDEQPAHAVKISAFWMATTELTYDAYTLFLNDENFSENDPVDAITRPSRPYMDLTLGMGKEGGFPANSMKQYAAIMYCKWLYEKTGVFYRLPTEAEWEYACRAGSETVYPFGKDSARLGEFAWYAANSEGSYHKVAAKQPNAWGLYDMLGNLQEWVLDQYQEDFYAKAGKETVDPVNTPKTKHPLVLRGGNFMDNADVLRPANRLPSELIWNRRDPQIPKSRWWNADAPFVGFRIVRPLQQPTKEEAAKFYATYLDL